MIVNNFISTLSIAEAIARETEHEITSLDDFNEFAFECLRLINAPLAFVHKVHIAPTYDYKLLLPDDLLSVEGVRDYSSKKVLTLSSDIYYQQTEQNSVTYPLLTSNSETLPTATFYIDGVGNPILPYGYMFPNMISDSYETLINSRVASKAGEYTYKVDSGWLTCSLQNSYLEIAYQAFPVDEFGFPLIPDDQSFINAVKYYVIERLDFKLWRKGKIADKVYAKSEQERLFYIAQASNKAKMPMSIDEWEAFRRISTRLISRPTQYSSGFKYLNREESLQFNRPRYVGFTRV